MKLKVILKQKRTPMMIANNSNLEIHLLTVPFFTKRVSRYAKPAKTAVGMRLHVLFK